MKFFYNIFFYEVNSISSYLRSLIQLEFKFVEETVLYPLNELVPSSDVNWPQMEELLKNWLYSVPQVNV